MKRNFDLRAIVFALFALLAVLMIMIQLQKTRPKASGVLEKLPDGERIAIVDSSYINLPFSFTWTMPNKNWRLRVLSRDTVLAPYSAEMPAMQNIKWLAAATRFQNLDSLAFSLVGVFKNMQQESTYDLAVDLLAEEVQKIETQGHRATILQPVTAPAHQILKGAYFVVMQPAVPADRVHLVALLPRAGNMFVLTCYATNKNYDLLRPEWQTLVQRFYPLPQIQYL